MSRQDTAVTAPAPADRQRAALPMAAPGRSAGPGTARVLSVLAALAAAPAAAALGVYLLTGDASLRPLGITVERLAASGDAGTGMLGAHLAPPAGAAAPERYARAIRESFAAQGIRVQVTMLPATGEGWVVFMLGDEPLGRYPLARAAEGIPMATAAWRLAQEWR